MEIIEQLLANKVVLALLVVGVVILLLKGLKMFIRLIFFAVAVFAALWFFFIR